MAEERKSWWQTAAGLMTGVATLITACTGLWVALHQIQKDSDGGKLSGEQSTSTHAPSRGDSKLTRKSEGQVLGETQTVDRAAYSVPLPATHEFVLGFGSQIGRFIVTNAQIESHTAEADILKIGVQVVADGEGAFPFIDAQFELRIDERPYKSTTSFDELIPAGQSRDHTLHFTIPHGTTRAVLWIHQTFILQSSNAEMPLDLTAPD